MYFIAKGICSIDVIDEKNQVQKYVSVLQYSDYFGEISLIYGCPRTASVIARNYNTIA